MIDLTNALASDWRDKLQLNEQYIYGSARLGMRQTSTIVSKRNFLASFNGVTGRFVGYQALTNQSGNTLTPQTTELLSVENNYTIEQTQRVLGMRMFNLQYCWYALSKRSLIIVLSLAGFSTST
jgi:hypothetical protein